MTTPETYQRSVFSAGLALIGAAVGFAGGFVVRGDSAAAMPSAMAAVSHPGQASAKCPFDLPRDQAAALDGIRCPGADCQGRLLNECHCSLAHGVKAVVHNMSDRGLPRESIRRAAEDMAKQ